MNYQVMLTDDADQPLANQTVEMTFTIYDAENDGTALWTETQNPTTNSIGVASLVLGSVVPIDCSFDGPRWLEIDVDGDVLAPRRELVTVPYAGRAASAVNADSLGGIDASEYALLDDLGQMGDGHSLNADDGSPIDALYVDSSGEVGIGTTAPSADLEVVGDVRIGSAGPTGGLTVGGGGADGYALLESDGPEGPRLTMYGGSGNRIAALGSVPNPPGGELLLYRNAAQEVGVELTANWYGTEDARLYMGGNSDVFEVNLNWGTSDGKVKLPDGSVSAGEILDDPGVTSLLSTGTTTLGGSPTSLGIRSLTAPADGYILAIGTAEVWLSHTYNTSNNVTRAQIGLTDDFPNYAPSQSCKVQVPDRVASGTYRHTVTVHGVFSATGGLTKTVRMYGQNLVAGSCYAMNVHITLLFIPNNDYGTVQTIDAPGALEWTPGHSATDDAFSDPRNPHPGVSAASAIQNSTEDTMEVPRSLLEDLLERVERLERERDQQ
jgi:hypothetical protein